MKYRTILLFGAPGAGKGTQGKILGTIPNFYHFACGDVFRNLTVQSELGRVFLEYSNRGELVPDGPTIRLWREHIEAATKDGRFDPVNDTLVLDGIPRSAAQVKILREFLDVKLILYLTCSDMDRMVARLQSRALRENRLDDANISVIRQRLDVFERATKPVLDCYGAKFVKKIDSAKSPIAVLRDILSAVEKAIG